MTKRYLEDFEAGQRFGGAARIRVEKDRIMAFAAEFDPQPFHLDEAAASGTVFRGLAASGWHTAAATMRLLVESDFKPVGGIVGAGFDELRWPLPVRPGDELRVESEVLEVRPSKSRPDQGLIKVRATTLNQYDEAVQISVGTLVVPRRASFQEISERFSAEPGLPGRGRVSSFPQATQKIAFNGRSTNTERSHRMKINAAGSPGVERNTQAFLEALAAGGGKPIEQLSPTDARAVLTGAQAGVKLDLPKADIAEKTVSVDGENVDLTVVRPAGAKEVLPVFMFFHGGGWVLGDFPTHERLVRDLVAGSGAAAVFVNYTPSPEARYPTAINQAYAATKWVAEHGQEINVDGKRLAVVGNSVGGNMAAVVSLMAKDRGTTKIKYQVLLWPVTDANFQNASYHQFAEGHFLTRNMMKWFWDNYSPDPKQRQDAYASPLQATTERLRDLPPALIQTAEMDVLRDEGEAYGRKLDAAGVDVTVVRYNGLIHDYGLLNALSQVPGVRSAILQASEELKKRLQ